MQDLPLRDIHWPDPVGIWPLAPGWWIVLLLLLVGGIGGMLWWRKPTRLLIHLALKELQAIEYNDVLSPVARCRQLSQLLRRVCISLYPRETVAGLTGQSWLCFLDQVLDQPRFSQDVGHHLIETAYQQNVSLTADDLRDLFRVTRDWLQSQHDRK